MGLQWTIAVSFRVIVMGLAPLLTSLRPYSFKPQTDDDDFQTA